MKGLKAESGLDGLGREVIDSAERRRPFQHQSFHPRRLLYVASGDDAFHADETLTVTGGVIRIRERR